MKQGVALSGREAGIGDRSTVAQRIGDGLDLFQLMRCGGMLPQRFMDFTGLPGIELAKGVGSEVRVILRIHGVKWDQFGCGRSACS